MKFMDENPPERTASEWCIDLDNPRNGILRDQIDSTEFFVYLGNWEAKDGKWVLGGDAHPSRSREEWKQLGFYTLRVAE